VPRANTRPTTGPGFPLGAGDKVKFDAEQIGGAYTVTRIEAVK
jgi:hypothetical protein